MCGQVYKGVEDAGKCVLADHADGFPYTDVISPAGQVYKGVEDAGKCVLADYAGGFPNTDVNSILPPVIVTTYPKLRESTGDIKKNKTRNYSLQRSRGADIPT